MFILSCEIDGVPGAAIDRDGDCDVSFSTKCGFVAMDREGDGDLSRTLDRTVGDTDLSRTGLSSSCD